MDLLVVIDIYIYRIIITCKQTKKSRCMTKSTQSPVRPIKTDQTRRMPRLIRVCACSLCVAKDPMFLYADSEG